MACTERTETAVSDYSRSNGSGSDAHRYSYEGLARTNKGSSCDHIAPEIHSKLYGGALGAERADTRKAGFTDFAGKREPGVPELEPEHAG